ncbi:site-specific DNA-adenine methylase [Constrictibacter sp. MBR-5]|uniref:DNA adenine methylase n=1 Tax=Constrictibacter sp. MBR-5 TaxID=3156467 RepID=UPI003391D806
MYRYRGSKATLSPAILALISADTRHYIEPFAGSTRTAKAIISDSRFNGLSVTISDTDYVIFLFWKILRDEPKHLQSAIWDLVNKLLLPEQQRVWYRRTRVRLRVTGAFSCPIRRSAAFFMCSHYSRNGVALPREGFHSGGWSDFAHLKDAIRRVGEWSELFSNVEILHSDYRSVINRYASPYATFYLDPPYQFKYTDSIYWGGMDHIAFLNFISQTDARWILTYDVGQELREQWRMRNFWIDEDIGGIYARSRNPRTEFIARSQAPSLSALRRYNKIKRRLK